MDLPAHTAPEAYPHTIVEEPMTKLAEGVTYAAPPDPRAWHKNALGYHLGWGYVGPTMASRFHFGADRSLVQIEVFGYYAGIYR